MPIGYTKTTVTTLITVVMMTKMIILKSEPGHDDTENIGDGDEKCDSNT